MNTVDTVESIKADPGWTAFVCAVFFMGLSLPAARAFAVLSFVFSITYRSRSSRSPFRLSPPVLGWLVYLALAIAVTAIMAAVNTDPLIEPAKGLGKINKLAWFAVIPLTAAQVNTPDRFRTTLKALVAGCLITALFVLFINPIGAWLQTNWPADTSSPDVGIQQTLVNIASALGITKSIDAWVHSGYRAAGYMASLVKLGTMQDAQRLMVAMPAALCLLIDMHREGATKKRKIFAAIALAVIFCGLMLTFKRGQIICAVLICGLIALRLIGAKAVLALVLASAIFAAHPAVRMRFSQLPEEFSTAKGGRALMWTKIVPGIHAEHPYGIGFRALTNEKMRQHGKHVEQRQNHVHSTPLQSFVDFGWLGVGAYAFWMAAAFYAAIRTLLKTRARKNTHDKPPAIRYVPLAMLTALALYGLIEYNLADAEIVLLYSLAMGMSLFPMPTALPHPTSKNESHAP